SMNFSWGFKISSALFVFFPLDSPSLLLGMGFLYFAYTKGVNPWPPVEVKVKKENRAERKRKARKKS
ncbi:MAG: hypothetical protein AAFV78_08330, partial [Bacteroidota bacterium]